MGKTASGIQAPMLEDELKGRPLEEQVAILKQRQADTEERLRQAAEEHERQVVELKAANDELTEEKNRNDELIRRQEERINLGKMEADLRNRPGVEYNKPQVLIKGNVMRDGKLVPANGLITSPKFPNNPVLFKDGRAVINDVVVDRVSLAQSIARDVLIQGKVVDRPAIPDWKPVAAKKGK